MVVDAERGAGIALRVEVDDENLQPLQREGGRDVDRSGGLPDPALLIGDREHPLMHGARQARLGVKQADGAFGFSSDGRVDDVVGNPSSGRVSGHVSRETSVFPVRADRWHSTTIRYRIHPLLLPIRGARRFAEPSSPRRAVTTVAGGFK